MVAPVKANDATLIADFEQTADVNVTQFGTNDAPFDNVTAVNVQTNAAPNGVNEGLRLENTDHSPPEFAAGGRSFTSADFTDAILVGGQRHKIGSDNGENYSTGGYGMVLEDSSGFLRAWKYGGLDEIRDNDSMFPRFASANVPSTFDGNSFTESGSFDITDIVRAGYFSGVTFNGSNNGTVILQLFYVVDGVTVTRGDSTTPATWFDFKNEADNMGDYDMEIMDIIGGSLFRGVVPVIFGADDANEHVFDTSGQSLGWIQAVNDLNTIITGGGNGERYGMIVGDNDLGLTLEVGSNFTFNMAFGSMSSFVARWYLRINGNTNTTEECNFTSMAFSRLGNDAARTAKNTRFQLPAAFTGCAFDDCERLDVNDSPMRGCTFSNPADGYAVVIDENHDIVGCDFVTDTATDIAILVDDTGGATITLDAITFNGFTDNVEIDSSITSGTYTFNLSNGTTLLDSEVVRDAGVTVIIATTPVTLTLTVVDIDTSAVVSGVRAYVTATATGPLPFQDSVTITRVTTTATVAHTAHGLANGQKVVIAGANQAEYNGIHTISNVSTNAYDYTVSGSPTTPATGTIISTAVIISGTTNGSGIIADTRGYASNQEFSGQLRKASTADNPKYKPQPLAGTIDSVGGLSITVAIVPDEA